VSSLISKIWMLVLVDKLVQYKLLNCYNSIILELIKERNLVLRLIQENLIENSVQDGLPYILITHGLFSTILAYPTCISFKVNIC